MSTYSFKDVVATIDGPGGTIPLSGGVGSAKEGITIAPTGDKSAMLIGADGGVQHSLMADDSGTVTVRLLKTSPINAALMKLYEYQTRSSARHGKNTIQVRDLARGDAVDCSLCAFKKAPDLTYADEAGTIEWAFDAGRIQRFVGIGTPEV